jgi:hypothetical protein
MMFGWKRWLILKQTATQKNFLSHASGRLGCNSAPLILISDIDMEKIFSDYTYMKIADQGVLVPDFAADEVRMRLAAAERRKDLGADDKTEKVL